MCVAEREKERKLTELDERKLVLGNEGIKVLVSADNDSLLNLRVDGQGNRDERSKCKKNTHSWLLGGRCWRGGEEGETVSEEQQEETWHVCACQQSLSSVPHTNTHTIHTHTLPSSALAVCAETLGASRPRQRAHWGLIAFGSDHGACLLPPPPPKTGETPGGPCCPLTSDSTPKLSGTGTGTCPQPGSASLPPLASPNPPRASVLVPCLQHRSD